MSKGWICKVLIAFTLPLTVCFTLLYISHVSKVSYNYAPWKKLFKILKVILTMYLYYFFCLFHNWTMSIHNILLFIIIMPVVITLNLLYTADIKLKLIEDMITVCFKYKYETRDWNDLSFKFIYHKDRQIWKRYNLAKSLKLISIKCLMEFTNILKIPILLHLLPYFVVFLLYTVIYSSNCTNLQ